MIAATYTFIFFTHTCFFISTISSYHWSFSIHWISKFEYKEYLLDFHRVEILFFCYNGISYFQHQKMKEFLEIERQNEIMQKQEIELAQTSKQNKEKVILILV